MRGVHSGPRWQEQFDGGRGSTLDLPDAPIIGVYDPGYMVISQGSRPLCTLEGGGTRRRSVYRLCNALPDVLGIVVSQDGDARFVRWNDSQVMYWNHSPLTPP